MPYESFAGDSMSKLMTFGRHNGPPERCPIIRLWFMLISDDPSILDGEDRGFENRCVVPRSKSDGLNILLHRVFLLCSDHYSRDCTLRALSPICAR